MLGLSACAAGRLGEVLYHQKEAVGVVCQPVVAGTPRRLCQSRSVAIAFGFGFISVFYRAVATGFPVYVEIGRRKREDFLHRRGKTLYPGNLSGEYGVF